MKPRLKYNRQTNARGFTRCELVLTVSALSLVLLTALAMTPQEHAKRAGCANNLRQLGVAALAFSSENDGEFPPRRPSPNHWVARLKEYYVSDRVVACPKGHDMEATPHSYLINGWNDYFEQTLSADEVWIYHAWLWPYGMREADIPEPRNTILFGEKLRSSYHVHMDFEQTPGNDVDEVDHARHFAGRDKRKGASNFAFVDGSVRLLPYGGSLTPVNLWAVIPEYRSQTFEPLP